jgi:Holliday junction resolvase
MKINSKQKGNRYERLISELFTEISGVKYRRVPMSGAIRYSLPGDIMKDEQKESCFDDILIELKNRKTLSIPAWIKESEDEMLDAGWKRFILVFRYNAKNYFILNEDLFKKVFKKQ